MTDIEIEARLREMLAESGIDGEGTEELVGRLRELDRYVDEDPPEPSPQLAAMMAGLARNVVSAPFGGRRRTRLFIAGAAAFGTVAAGGIAAAANELPPAAQTIVAEFSESYLPFELPYPDELRQPRLETPDDDAVITTDTEAPGDKPEAPAATSETGTTTAAEPTPEPSVAPTPSAVPTPTTEPTVGTTEPTVPPTEPSVAPDPSDVPTDDVTDGDTQAGESPSADPSGTSDPSPSPSASSSPSPTANTRNEAGDDPSSSPSSSPSSTTSPSPSPSPSAVWSDG